MQELLKRIIADFMIVGKSLSSPKKTVIPSPKTPYCVSMQYAAQPKTALSANTVLQGRSIVKRNSHPSLVLIKTPVKRQIKSATAKRPKSIPIMRSTPQLYESRVMTHEHIKQQMRSELQTWIQLGRQNRMEQMKRILVHQRPATAKKREIHLHVAKVLTNTEI